MEVAQLPVSRQHGYRRSFDLTRIYIYTASPGELAHIAALRATLEKPVTLAKSRARVNAVEEVKRNDI
jgi:hypothetical protein